jgi:SP family galactose:H+ symporter-like MFS transporter
MSRTTNALVSARRIDGCKTCMGAPPQCAGAYRRESQSVPTVPRDIETSCCVSVQSVSRVAAAHRQERCEAVYLGSAARHRNKALQQMEYKVKSDVKGFVYVAVGVAAIGGLLFGYDTGVISGAIIFVKKQFSLSATMEEIVVSSVLAGAVVGAILGGALTDRFGRRKLIILAGVIFTASAIGTALAPMVRWLIAGRIVSGIAIGIASFISPMYIAELAPAKLRGALVAVNMLAIATGIVAAYLVDYVLSGSQEWRYMFGLAAIPSVALVVGMWPLPDSPRWLLSGSKVPEATRALQRLRIASDVGPEISDIKQSMAQQSGAWTKELFQPALKMPLIVGLGLAVLQQITGINTVMYYSPTIFKFVGINGITPAILAGAGLAMVMWCVYALAIFLLDRVGRRPLLLFGIAGQVIGLAVLGAAFQFQQMASFKSYIAIGGLVIYVASFAIGLGPVFWLLISEIYPLKFRGTAMSAVTVTNWGMNMAVAVTFLTMVDLIGRAGTFWLYGVIAVGAWFFCYRLVPETKGKTLEQIEAYWRSGKSPREF